MSVGEYPSPAPRESSDLPNPASEIFDRQLFSCRCLMATLRTEGLTKSYGGRIVVRGVNLDLASGEVVGLLGPNGAGKTTTFI